MAEDQSSQPLNMPINLSHPNKFHIQRSQSIGSYQNKYKDQPNIYNNVNSHNIADTTVNINETDHFGKLEPSAGQLPEKINSNFLDSKYKTPMKSRHLEKLVDIATQSAHYQSHQQP